MRQVRAEMGRGSEAAFCKHMTFVGGGWKWGIGRGPLSSPSHHGSPEEGFEVSGHKEGSISSVGLAGWPGCGWDDRGYTVCLMGSGGRGGEGDRGFGVCIPGEGGQEIREREGVKRSSICTTPTNS